MSAATDAFVNQNRGRLLAELKDFVRIPSISTLPENRPHIERAARFVVPMRGVMQGKQEITVRVRDDQNP